MIGIRVVQGIAGGLSFPSFAPLFALWAPKNEKSRMASIAVSGTHFGAVIANLLSGYLSVNFGWPSIFYSFGTAGLVWYVFWIILVRKSPDYDRCITRAEKDYIRENLDNKIQEKLNVPWKKIFTSKAVWAIAIAHSSFNWGFYTLLTQLPSYLKDTLKFELESTGYISALPYFLLGLIQSISGSIADWMKIKGFVTVGFIRKCYICIPYIVQGSLLIAVAYIPDPNTCVVLITLAVAVGGFASSGKI